MNQMMEVKLVVQLKLLLKCFLEGHCCIVLEVKVIIEAIMIVSLLQKKKHQRTKDLNLPKKSWGFFLIQMKVKIQGIVKAIVMMMISMKPRKVKILLIMISYKYFLASPRKKKKDLNKIH